MRDQQLTECLQIFEVLIGGRSYPLDAFSFLNVHEKTLRRRLAALERIDTFRVKHSDYEGTTYWRSDYRPIQRQPQFTKKKCSGCGRKLPLSQFGRNRGSPDGRHAYCLQCRVEYNRAYYRNNAERLKAYDRKRYHKRRSQLLAYMKRHYQEKKQCR